MILNEQLIENMFVNESNPNLQENLANQVSLNFTVTSRSSKLPKINTQESPLVNTSDSLHLATSQLTKFNHWFQDFTTKHQETVLSVDRIISQVQPNKQYISCLKEVEHLKEELTKRDYSENQKVFCKLCVKNKKIIEETVYELESQKELNCIKQQESRTVLKESLRQMLLGNTEILCLKDQIKELKDQLTMLRHEKTIFQKTNLFNKTKNSNMQRMDLDKVLSAAKNSTNSSQLLKNRHHESLIFIDPFETDVDQWIKFYQHQKKKYQEICKKQNNEIKREQKQANKILTQEQKKHVYVKGVFLVYHQIKKIIQSLNQIKKTITTFDSNKINLRDKQYDQQNEDVKEEAENLRKKVVKLQKINQSLDQENKQLMEINEKFKQLEINKKSNQNSYEKKINQDQKRLDQYHHRIKFLENQLQIYTDKLSSAADNLHKIRDQKIKLESRIEELELYIMKLNDKVKHEGDKQLRVTQSKLKEAERFVKEISQKKRQSQIEIKLLEIHLKKEICQRKKLHNQIQDIKGTIRVYCRIRPKLKNEANVPIFLKNIEDRISFGDQKLAKFDKVYNHQNNKQQYVFNDIKGLVQSAFDGHNLCIFAYGQTGSGKTYTIHGNQQDPGIAPRIFHQLFRLIEAEKNVMEVSIQMNMVQIYNEKVHQLFKTDKSNKPIEIKEQEDGFIYLTNCPNIKVQSIKNMEDIYLGGMKNRRVRQTQKNDESSRSHFLLTIVLECICKKSGQRYFSKINLIDLAGAERLSSDDPLIAKETTCINKSLASLTNVITALANKQEHIPYRDNKLTHLLKDSLNSKSKMLVFINVASGENHKDQSINSILFGQKIKGVQRNFKKNKEDKQFHEGKENREEIGIREKRTSSRQSNE